VGSTDQTIEAMSLSFGEVVTLAKGMRTQAQELEDIRAASRSTDRASRMSSRFSKEDSASGEATFATKSMLSCQSAKTISPS
jgi:hypothetical protein